MKSNSRVRFGFDLRIALHLNRKRKAREQKEAPDKVNSYVRWKSNSRVENNFPLKKKRISKGRYTHIILGHAPFALSYFVQFLNKRWRERFLAFSTDLTWQTRLVQDVMSFWQRPGLFVLAFYKSSCKLNFENFEWPVDIKKKKKD